MQYKPPKRNYAMKDDTFLRKASSITEELSKHLAHFQNFDSGSFSTEFVAKLEDTRQQILSIPSDRFIKATLAVKTAAMQEALQACVDEMQVAKYFIKKLYKRGSVEYDRFGFKKLVKCRYSPEKMFGLFEFFIDCLEKRREQLLSVHYPESKFTELYTLCKELETKRIEQNSFKADRMGQTHTRITLLNQLWKDLKKVEEVASNFIFQEDPEMRKRFRVG